LRTNHGKRIAVIENEFSEGLGIESMIAKSGVDGKNISDFFELPNGCVRSIYHSTYYDGTAVILYSIDMLHNKK